MKIKYDESLLVEKMTKSEEIYKGNLLHVFKDTIELPNGNTSTRELIRHIGAVAIVPVTKDGKIIIERQYRYPLGQVITEIPAGKRDSKEEDTLKAAKRELREETGLLADKWTYIGLYHPAAAYTDESIAMFMAEGLHKTEQELDEDEFLHVYEVPLKDVVDEIMSGEITDGKTLAAVMKVAFIMNTK